MDCLEDFSFSVFLISCVILFIFYRTWFKQIILINEKKNPDYLTDVTHQLWIVKIIEKNLDCKLYNNLYIY